MKCTINSKQISLKEANLEKSLMDFLREDLNLTGTKNGCGIGVCGTCTVLIDGKTAKACRKTVKDIVEKELLTIEGMEQEDGSLHPLQQAFLDAGAIQCGFCTPGMVLTGHALLKQDSAPSREKIKKALNPVLCRCTGYQQIVDAVELAAKEYK